MLRATGPWWSCAEELWGRDWASWCVKQEAEVRTRAASRKQLTDNRIKFSRLFTLSVRLQDISGASNFVFETYSYFK